MGRQTAGATLLAALFFAVAASVCTPAAADDKPAAAKPKVAVFPLAGDAAGDVREKVGFALRRKLDRDGTYEVINGPAMMEIAGAADAPVTAETAPGVVVKLSSGESPTVLVWGDLKAGADGGLSGSTLRLKLLDTRTKDAKPVEVTKAIGDPTDLRFVTEEVLAAFPGVGGFDRSNEQPVKDDAVSRAMWAKNPNLLANGDLSDTGAWDGIYMAEKYRVKAADDLPPVDKVAIYRMPAGDAGPAAKPNPVLGMNLSRTAAENNGLACLSDPIRVKPNTRYRISFRYRSDGPTARVFVKGYTKGQNLKGQPADREVFRTQVPPAGPTDGKWQTVVCDVNPFHPAFPVQTLRVDLYAYLSPGVILWDDVVVKEIGPLPEKPKDAALDKPLTRPR